MRTSDVCPTCSTFENALCSIYNGAFLVTLDINTLDSVEDALIKIETFAFNVSGLTNVSDIPYAISWDGNLEVATKNAQYDAFVPYTGATTDVDLGTNSITVDSILLNTGAVALLKSITDDVTTTYNFVLADANNEVTLNNGAAVAAILPANGTIPIPVGSSITVINKGAGVVTLSVTTDTINTDTGSLTMAQYAVRTLYKIAATEWIVGF